MNAAAQVGGVRVSLRAEPERGLQAASSGAAQDYERAVLGQLGAAHGQVAERQMQAAIQPAHLQLPFLAHVGRIARAALAEHERAQFLLVARAKGASFFRVWVLHALPASVGPIATVVGTQLGALLGGAVVLERLFERPGLGSLILESYSARDLPVLEAAIVLTGTLFVLAQSAAQAVHGALDPRVRR